MIDFTQVEEIELDGELVEKIEIDDVVVWENIKSILLSSSEESTFWGQDIELTATVTPPKEGLTVDFYSDKLTCRLDNSTNPNLISINTSWGMIIPETRITEEGYNKFTLFSEKYVDNNIIITDTDGNIISTSYIWPGVVEAPSGYYHGGISDTIILPNNNEKYILSIETDESFATVTTDENGQASVIVNKDIPQEINFTAKVKRKISPNLSINWIKRNLTIRPLHTGTLYYGHYLRYKVTDGLTGEILPNLTGYINYGAGNDYNVTVNSSGYCQLQLNVGTKTTTTSTTYTGKCQITGNELYNDSSLYSASYSYIPSKKYNSSLSSASSDHVCEVKYSGSYTYGRWYPSSTDYTLVEALKGTGTVRSYLASSSGTSYCKTPEELYVRTNGKNGTSSVSGTVLAIGYYITARRNSTITTKFNNIKIQLYSNSEWTTKATASRTTTFPSSDEYTNYTGTFSFTPTMAQLPNIRLVASFTANTQSNLGYAYISEFYPQVWYSPTQTFLS